MTNSRTVYFVGEKDPSGAGFINVFGNEVQEHIARQQWNSIKSPTSHYRTMYDVPVEVEYFLVKKTIIVTEDVVE